MVHPTPTTLSRTSPFPIIYPPPSFSFEYCLDMRRQLRQQQQQQQEDKPSTTQIEATNRERKKTKS